MGTPSSGCRVPPGAIDRKFRTEGVPPISIVAQHEIETVEILRQNVSSPLLSQHSPTTGKPRAALPPPLIPRSSSALADPRDFTEIPLHLAETEVDDAETLFASSSPLGDLTNSSSLLDLTKAFKSPSPNKRIIHPTLPSSERPYKRAVLSRRTLQAPTAAAAVSSVQPPGTSDPTPSSSSGGTISFVTNTIHAGVKFVLSMPGQLMLLPLRLIQFALWATIGLWASLALSVLSRLLRVAEDVCCCLGLDGWAFPGGSLKMARGALTRAQAIW